MSDKSLYELAKEHDTDKANHGYCEIYEQKLGKRRLDSLKLLELGIYMGGSIRMWRDYFPNAEIHGLDLNIERCGHIDNVTLHNVDMSSSDELVKVSMQHGPWDIVLDDASHTMKHQQTAFDKLWPHIKPGGFYIVEDLHTSFMPKLEMHSANVKDVNTTYAMVEALKYGNPFGSNYMRVENFEKHKQSVEHVTIWVREPKEHSYQLTSNNSITSLILKRS